MELIECPDPGWSHHVRKQAYRYPCGTPRPRPSGPRSAEHHRTRPSSFRNNGTKQGNGTPKSKQCPTMPKVHVRRAFFLTCPQARAHAQSACAKGFLSHVTTNTGKLTDSTLFCNSRLARMYQKRYVSSSSESVHLCSVHTQRCSDAATAWWPWPFIGPWPAEPELSTRTRP